MLVVFYLQVRYAKSTWRTTYVLAVLGLPEPCNQLALLYLNIPRPQCSWCQNDPLIYRTCLVNTM